MSIDLRDSRKAAALAPGLILLTGLCLRLYQLGADSLWIDEVGVATAAAAPTFGGMLEIARGHVMAMPLDYVVAWLVGRFTLDEAALRLPAALWGTASIGIARTLFSRLSSKRIGLLAALFLALAPLHVQYSQEARFYAALVFFFLLCTWLLLRAVESPTPRNWLWFTIATSLGIFFHVYVVLVLVTGAGWCWMSFRDAEASRRRTYYLRSAIAVLLAFLAGMYFFGSFTGYDIPLLLQESSLWGLLGTGLGWVPFYPGAWPAWIFGLACALLALLGAGISLRRAPSGPASVLLYALVIQLGAILGVDVLKHYFASPRQLLIGLPVMGFFAAAGASALMDEPAAWRGRLAKIAPAACVVLLAVASLPALANYYAGDKGRVRELAATISAHWRAGEQVFVIPDFEVKTIAYYLRKQAGDSPVLGALRWTDWDALEGQARGDAPAYLFTPFALTDGQRGQARSLGFEPVVLPEAPSRYSHILWARGISP